MHRIILSRKILDTGIDGKIILKWIKEIRE
jgi:hypothetical protein